MEENPERNIVNKVVVVTGSSRGIGANIVKTLAKKGYRVILNYNKSENYAQNVQKELINVDIFKADVSKKAEAVSLINFAIEKYGKIDVLINNAGISQSKLFTDLTDEDWNNIINSNLNSAFFCSREAAKNMIHNKSGLIINISSIWGITGASCEVAYSTSKAALNGFTKALAKELGPSNIRVNAIAPGIINTDMNNYLSNEELESIKEEIPLERIGETIDISKCVEWLIEDNYTTGQIISINGGWVC
ncbi:MAG: 3-oxoacyl-ACP reductase FabG [Clostridia bacterium]|jgi:3-oxoacyl-[acyl-carrier protein] reductase